MKILITGSMGFISRNLIEKSLLNDERISKIYGIDHTPQRFDQKFLKPQNRILKILKP